MQLRCPYCRSLVRIDDTMRRYFGMPVGCHECARVFVVPPQSPLHDSALPADAVRPLDRSVSANRCFHERRCNSCGNTARLPGLERPVANIVMNCPYCGAAFESGRARGIRTGPVMLALVAGIGAGCGVLWLDHAGLIALQNLDMSRLLMDLKFAVRDWLGQLRTAAMARLV